MKNKSVAKIGGVFYVQHLRNGNLIDEWADSNLVCNEGLDNLLDVYLHNQTQTATWYVGIFEGNYTPVSTVTAATIAAASTESTAYAEAARQEWVETAASSQSITNSATKATFTINATRTIYGAFLASASAKSATTGVLFAATRFSAARSVVSGDQLLITYTVGATSS